MNTKEDFEDLLSQKITWFRTGDSLTPYIAVIDEIELRLRINEFPKETLYTLLVDGKPVGDLDDFPPSWSKAVFP